jgi:hypothetical protein
MTPADSFQGEPKTFPWPPMINGLHTIIGATGKKSATPSQIGRDRLLVKRGGAQKKCLQQFVQKTSNHFCQNPFKWGSDSIPYINRLGRREPVKVLSRKAFSLFLPAQSKNASAAMGTHARPKSDFSFSSSSVGIKRWFHKGGMIANEFGERNRSKF